MASSFGAVPLPSLKTAVVIVHVFALALSFGAVIFLDLFLLRYVLLRPVAPHAFDVASFGSRLVSVGLAVMWLSGLSFLLIYTYGDPIKLENPKLWSKMSIVAVLTLNGMIIHRQILPLLKRKVGMGLLAGETTHRVKSDPGHRRCVLHLVVIRGRDGALQ